MDTQKVFHAGDWSSSHHRPVISVHLIINCNHSYNTVVSMCRYDSIYTHEGPGFELCPGFDHIQDMEFGRLKNWLFVMYQHRMIRNQDQVFTGHNILVSARGLQVSETGYDVYMHNTEADPKT